ncbi:drug/metabolite transporter (DMT)-like permease [Peribacillus deserti]|uniref:Drug/metabolite transporter (DMT)-like permease n=1 Tax=Peribacillus deserti TaxID=673318 RepID=A0ABS2QHG9_9BACI|nr:EamA family transporter [Peribacillus deserti]MBM7692589.1 drug/metabolite transporter (DMT)-like permease [Peribacillus deserti]
MEKRNYIAHFSVLIAGILWGLIGIFVKGLNALDLSAMDIVAVRSAAAFLILLIGGLVFKRRELIIKPKDAYLFVGTGILSMVFFNWCYFTAMQMLNISLAVILLYTAPAFVLVLSSLILKETFTKTKLLLIICTLIGCTLVAGTNIGASGDLTLTGIIIGLGSGLGYALYSIFGKLALKKYSSYTISLYTFLFALIPLLPFTTFWTRLPSGQLFTFSMYTIGLGIISTVFAYLFYTSGLKKMESCKASLLSTVEPVTAMLIGFFLFGEQITGWQIAGSLLIILSVSAISVDFTRLKRAGMEHN